MSETWIEFDGKVRDIGNKGKSRGLNLSAYTNEQDIGRHIVGRFMFVDNAPNSEEYHEMKKQTLLTKRLDIVQDIKTFCAQNKLSTHARVNGIPEEEALTLTNLNYYFQIWLQLDVLNSVEPDKSLQSKLDDLAKQLQPLTIDVHEQLRQHSSGEEGVRIQYPRDTYALDKELDCVVHKDNLATYKPLRAEYLKLKKQIEMLQDKNAQRTLYLQTLTTIPNFILEAVVEDIDEDYTKKALQQLNKRVDAYIKNPTALLKRKSK